MINETSARLAATATAVAVSCMYLYIYIGLVVECFMFYVFLHEAYGNAYTFIVMLYS